MTYARRFAAAAWLLLFLSHASAQLPTAARLDLLELRMSEAVKAEKYPEFLNLLADFRRDGGRVGPELAYYEAVAHEKGGRPVRAAEAASAFITQAGREHPLYAQALLLYSRVEPAVQRIQETREGVALLLQALQQGQDRVRLQADAVGVDLAAMVRDARHVAGAVALPDGGWIDVGSKSLGSADKGTSAVWQRRGSDGLPQTMNSLDGTRHSVAELRLGTPEAPTALGIGVTPTTGPGTVVALNAGSVAAAAGLRLGDRITHVGGRELRAEDGLFHSRDLFYSVLASQQAPVRLGVQRAGHAGLLEIVVQAPPAATAATTPSMRFTPAVAVRARWSTGTPSTGTASDAAPRAEAVAWVAGTAQQGARLCANLRFSAHVGSAAYGFWGALDAEGAPDATRNLWGMPEDHPTAMDGKRTAVPWHDSAVFDCVALPDGAMLVASAATRRTGTGSLDNGVAGDRSNRAFRIVEADGRIRAHLLLQASKPVLDANARGVRTRFLRSFDDSGWRWAWGDWMLEASAGGLRQVDPQQVPPLVALRSSAQDRYHHLVSGNHAVPLIARATAHDVVLQQTARLPDGTALALVTLRLDRAVQAEMAPDGQSLGAELLHPDHSIGLLVALDPTGARPSWSVLLRHGLAEQARALERTHQAQARAAGSTYFAGSTLQGLGTRGLLWRSMVVLGDGSVRLQTGLGHGVWVRPDAAAAAPAS